MENEFSIEFSGHLEAQGGGHGRICKCNVSYPAISKPLDHREGKAYEDLQSTPLVDCIPKFYGIFDNKIIISDLTAGLTSPCVMDLKVGTRHYDLHATQKKIDELITKQKGSTTDSHGVRIIDGKLRKNGEVVKGWDRKQGLKISYDEFKAAIHEFLPGDLISQFRSRLQIIYGKLAQTIAEHPGYRMYASSILVAYDGDHPEKGIRCCLIDFAHTFINIEEDGGKIDDPTLNDGVMLGLDTLIHVC
ncbi:Inositol polyphosphate kinase family protein [Histomonas meleagridis]|uniref:Inositol polyphosphate kinase family protein n=1 Tax=Histomonas meleagridis TaxID=135588 RepID=UPI00355A870D|nr:Inositol polyphosphate kinase family protein [Histomonas meleagridis]KAH0805545.1 Inositol polyphosphate kinase family protein [Histomonas meleagridis]